MNSHSSMKKDHVLKSYFKVVRRAKDFLSVVLYNGEQELKIALEDTEETTVIDNGKHIDSIERRRDLFYKVNNEYVCLIGIENQDREDRNIVIRNMYYDTLNYLNQYDRYGEPLKQVITVVLHYGEEGWKAPIELKELIGDISNEDMFNNWKIPVYNVKDLDENLFQEKDNRDLIRGIKMFYKLKGSQEEINNFVFEVNREVAIVVASVTGCKELQKVIEGMEGERLDMCTGFRIYTETIQKEALAEGKQLGIHEGIEQSFVNLIEYGTNVYEAIRILKIPVQEQQYYIEKYS